jgi:Ca2+-binding RTX toxin-like protein
MAKIKGTSGDNFPLKGTKGKDTILGKAGVDQLLGLGGDDLLKGGTGVDFLVGATGRDKLLGGEDNDYLDPGGGRDVINGGGGDRDAVAYVGSKSGVKVKLGKDGATTVGKGGDAKGDQIKNVEIVHGSDHNDTLKGNNLDNFLFGHNGNDLLKAGGGDDTVDGGIGNDSLYGGKGADVLGGDLGDDDLFGGVGPDEFDFEAGDFGNDIIWDYEPGIDKIFFFDGPDHVSDIFGAASQMGSDVLIKYGTSSITLKQTKLTDLSPDDFEVFF